MNTIFFNTEITERTENTENQKRKGSTSSPVFHSFFSVSSVCSVVIDTSFGGLDAVAPQLFCAVKRFVRFLQKLIDRTGASFGET